MACRFPYEDGAAPASVLEGSFLAVPSLPPDTVLGLPSSGCVYLYLLSGKVYKGTEVPRATR